MKDDTIEKSAKILAQRQERVAQGDVDIVPCDSIPQGLARANVENGLIIVAHSESGHHHAFAYQEDIEVYDKDEFVSYIHNRSDNVIELRHHKTGPDRHKSIGVPPGVYRIVRGREYTPEGFRRARD